MVYIFADHKTDGSLTSKPDLLVIDGGKGQLSTIVRVLKKMKIDIPVIGLAKREEEVFTPGNSLPVLFEKDSQAKYLLIRLRDEAHRFANRHREKRGKAKATQSALDNIPGIGDKTKHELLLHFKTVAGIRDADDVQLRTLVTDAQLEQLRKHL